MGMCTLPEPIIAILDCNARNCSIFNDAYTVDCAFFYSDIDECNSSNGCDVNAHCHNNPGSYSCSCKIGFDGDGKTCAGKLRSNY